MAHPQRGGFLTFLRKALWRGMVAVAAAVLASILVIRPEDVPPAYAPWVPLDPIAAPNFVTPLKLMRTAADADLCRAALVHGAAQATALADRLQSEQCHVSRAVRLEALSRARLAPEAMRCGIALRLLMWERHALQPAALHHLGSQVAAIEHYGAYSCRPIRSHRGSTGRMSEHATANAFDISGFVLANGRRITLAQDWTPAGPEAAFLRAARDGLCRYFRVVLSPDYNALHADHFHVDQGLFFSCR